MRYEFASDNTSGFNPEALRALHSANNGFHPSYGDDIYTENASKLFRELFETDCDVYFVFNGTAANSLALASLCQSYHSIICHELAHIETDECGAPEFFSNGTKILVAPGEQGKLTPERVKHLITRRRDIHYPRPHVLSLSLPNEVGTLYSTSELQELCATAKTQGLKVHMDGSRFANALAGNKASAADLSWKAGVDVLCLGGTKCGIGMGEAVIFFNKSLSAEFGWRCKQAGQLASKMRFLAAPWAGALGDGSWLGHAAHANTSARLLADKVKDLPGVRLLYPVEANAVFLELPEKVHLHLRKKKWAYYVFIGAGARFMCSWATSLAEIEELAADIAIAARS